MNRRSPHGAVFFAFALPCVTLALWGCVSRRYNGARAAVKIEDAIDPSTWEDDERRFAAHVFPLWIYRCTQPRFEEHEPTLCTGTLLKGTNLLVTANHCIAPNLTYGATVLVPRDNASPDAKPPAAKDACAEAPPAGFERVAESHWKGGSATRNGEDLVLLPLLNLAPSEQGAGIAEVRDVREGATVEWFGFSTCVNGKAMSGGLATRRLEKAVVLHLDRSRGLIHVDHAPPVSCPANGGMAYLVRQEGEMKIIAFHMGEQAKAKGGDGTLSMYGTSVAGHTFCALLKATDAPRALLRNCEDVQ